MHLLLLIQYLAKIVCKLVSLGIIILTCLVMVVLNFIADILRVLTGINL